MALQVITPPLTDTALRDLRRRTAARLMQARVEMRAGWLLHPDNAVKRAIFWQREPRVEYIDAEIYADFKRQDVGRADLSAQVMPWSMSRNDIELLANLRGDCRP